MPKPTIIRALSVRQLYAEQILQGKKTIEYRTVRTNIIGERVYIYASKLFDISEDAWENVTTAPKDMPTGVLVGTVVIEKCLEEPDDDDLYEWHLVKPERLSRPLKPKNRAQPVWFKPF